MRVKYLRGDNKKYNPIYNVVIPEDTEIEDLPTIIQDSIKVLGELEILHAEDLSNKNDYCSSTIKKQIQENGASLKKFGWNLKETGWTFPPFSELDKLNRKK